MKTCVDCSHQPIRVIEYGFSGKIANPRCTSSRITLSGRSAINLLEFFLNVNNNIIALMDIYANGQLPESVSQIWADRSYGDFMSAVSECKHEEQASAVCASRRAQSRRLATLRRPQPTPMYQAHRPARARLVPRRLSIWRGGPDVCLAFQHMFLGFWTLADWLGSDERHLVFCNRPGADYIDTTRKRARKAASDISLDLEKQRNALQELPGFTAFFDIDGFPNATQQKAAELPFEEQLVIIASERSGGMTSTVPPIASPWTTRLPPSPRAAQSKRRQSPKRTAAGARRFKLRHFQ